jgi:hypothetical protein
MMMSDVESEVGRACALVGEIVDGRTTGNRDTIAGNSDDDLLGALEDAQSAIAAAIEELQGA